MSWFGIAGLLVAGVINLLPLPGAFGASALARLYDIRTTDPNLLIMLRHRASVFAIIGALLLGAIWRPELQAAAILAGLASALSLAVIALQTGGYSPALRRVVIADFIAIAALIVAGIDYLVA